MINHNKNKILCFGELLLHFAPDIDGNWLKDQTMKTFVGGAEYNVASALAQWGYPVRMLSALPENYMGRHLVSKLENEGIELLADKSQGRIGTFYLPSAGDMQHHGVLYDRFPSVFTDSDFSAFSSEELFSGVQWLHITTITPALSNSALEKCISLIKDARQRNINVSLDLNYRESLWADKDPAAVMLKLMPYVDVLMGNIWSIERFLNIPVEYQLNGRSDDHNLLKQAEKSALRVIELYPNISLVANTFRFAKEDVDYFATLFSQNILFVSKKYHADKVEERVGSGDSFMAALIHGKLKNNAPQQILEDATKVAFKKLFVKGDTINETINIENL